MTNERPGTDHLILGPIRGLKKTASDDADTQTDGHCDSKTESDQWADSVKIKKIKILTNPMSYIVTL